VGRDVGVLGVRVFGVDVFGVRVFGELPPPLLSFGTDGPGVTLGLFDAAQGFALLRGLPVPHGVFVGRWLPLAPGFGPDAFDLGLLGLDGSADGFGPVGVDVGDAVGEDVDGGEVVPEKPNTACSDRVTALGASATARMLRGFADASGVADAGSRSVPVRSRGFSPTSPRAQSSRPGTASVQPAGRLVQARGRSAVSRSVASRATPPSAWTRTVYARA
jgi:hypothetical protein